jgi:hypothetical protein
MQVFCDTSQFKSSKFLFCISIKPPKSSTINSLNKDTKKINSQLTQPSIYLGPTNVYRTLAYYQPKTEIGWRKTSHSSTGEKSTNNRHWMSVFGQEIS